MTDDLSLRAEFMEFAETCTIAYPLLKINQGFQHWRDTIERKIAILEQRESKLRKQLRWIPVSEIPPEEGVALLIRYTTFGEPQVPQVKIYHRDNNQWSDTNLDYWIDAEYVTEWMPIPEAAK